MKHVEVYQNGEDNGWLHKQNYWFDPNHEHGFNIVDLDSIYPPDYFKHDHVKPQTIEAYCKHVPMMFEELTGRKPTDLIEFGSAGGWFLKRFNDLGYHCIGLEGTTAGINECIKRGVPATNIRKHDLRNPYVNGLAYDIALCTEVAEHIEPPFSAILVKSLTDSSDFIWFSFEEPNTNPAHIHHPNEMPAKFWINLFDYYGFSALPIPKWISDQCEGRGTYIFYNRQRYDFSIVL
jgi:hypothetical protein